MMRLLSGAFLTVSVYIDACEHICVCICAFVCVCVCGRGWGGGGGGGGGGAGGLSFNISLSFCFFQCLLLHRQLLFTHNKMVYFLPTEKVQDPHELGLKSDVCFIYMLVCILHIFMCILHVLFWSSLFLFLSIYLLFYPQVLLTASLRSRA